ncbi:MAG: OB-fold domain-containing protein [Bryobacteraceae bacterium]|nr:OB-fold domain-containing protein [Bryobacteraceae bacterium]
MIGIARSSLYVPRHRLSRELIAQAWGSRAMPGAKAIAGFDEDALTMGYAAAWALGDLSFHRLYFASTSAPFWQRSTASQIAAACDLPARVATADFGGSLRAGTSALHAAFDAVQAGPAESVAVVASEARDPEPESAEEMLFGDAAAALLVSGRDLAAELIARVSRYDHFLDEWRRDTDAEVHAFSGRFTTRHGLEENAIAAARELLSMADARPEDITLAILPSPDGKAHLTIAKALALDASRVADPGVSNIGVTGAAMPLLLLASALKQTPAGARILLVSYGDGADVFLFRATGTGVHPLPPDSRTIPVSSYARYKKLRHVLSESGGGAEMSNVFWKREEAQNVRLRGSRCGKCGLIQFPMAQVCEKCHSSGAMQDHPLSRTGRIFTFNKDYLYDSPVQPNLLAVVDLTGGGRILCQVTDAGGDAAIGMDVELVLRRMKSSSSLHHYYWKCRPL